MNKRSNGFTVIELLVAIVIIGTASVLFFAQKGNLQIAARDQQRKTSINAMYYSLEEVFYKTNNYYPATIETNKLPSVDPALFNDPSNVRIGDASSNYRYEAVNCVDNKCKSYTLRSTLENEADFIKESKNS